MKKNAKLEEMVGKLPENWETMSSEEKIIAVMNKWELLSQDDMYDIELNCGKNQDNTPCMSLEIAANADHQFTESGACFALKKPVPADKFVITGFPEYLRDIIEEKAMEDWNTDEKDYNMLSTCSVGGTFAEAAKDMYLLLDLLTCGYKITEIEWFMEQNSELYPDFEANDDDGYDLE
jgi:hypothetical protein